MLTWCTVALVAAREFYQKRRISNVRRDVPQRPQVGVSR
jgi:hypothetical protein